MKKWSKQIIALILAVALVAGLAVCAVRGRELYSGNNQMLDVTAQETETPTAAQTPDETPIPEDAPAETPVSQPQPEQTQQQTPAAADEGVTVVDTIDAQDRDELEQVVTMLDTTVSEDNLSDMDDEQLQERVQELVEQLEESETSKVVDLGITDDKKTTPTLEPDPDNYDKDGAMIAPFDQLYPELIEQELVEFEDETVLVKLPNSSEGAISGGMASAGVAKLTAIVPMAEATWYEASLRKGTDVTAAVEALRALDEVLLVDYNYRIQTAAIDAAKELPGDRGFENNKHHKDQWHLRHCGISDGMAEMQTEGGDSGVIVAVIDTGVDYDHEDLAQNMWVNRGETPDDGVDNDGNGYVDDYYGANMVTDQGNGDDDNGHGTHVAGIIAAQNNNLGVVGLAYNVKIMPIKAAMASGYLNQADIAEAVIYAYENGADVINMSFGGTACSIAVQDALATAFTRCVLVASAGNDGAPNEGIGAIPNYPAALSYVLGVMSVDQTGVESAFTNYDMAKFNGVEYELYAPGNEIMSTLPNDRYGILSGTSMAAPMVSAMAAILRSEFTDRDTYPTRFIYGQLASTSGYTATCLDPETHGKHNLPQIVNLYSALTVMPKPELGLQDYHLFDTEGFADDTSGRNNGDGVVDAGETIALGLTLRNRWGQSKNTMVTIDTLSMAGIPDPYIEIINPTVDYGSIGTYATGDCGRIYTDEIITAWERPFYIKIAEDCPNDYIFNLNVTITCGNHMDPGDTSTYTTIDKVMLTVRSGYVLPTIIDEDMTLTKENLYIISNSTVIEEGVTVTVEPGTHIQFWSDDAKDPYAMNYIAYLQVDGEFLVEGTAEEPVMIYPSQLMDAYGVQIKQGENGYVSLRYADVTTLFESKIAYAERTTFRQNYYDHVKHRDLYDGDVRDRWGNSITLGFIQEARDCVFYKIAMMYGAVLTVGADRCVFVDCGITFGTTSDEGYGLKNCVMLGNANLELLNNTSYNSDYAESTISVEETDISRWSSDNGNGNPWQEIRVGYWPEKGTTYFNARHFDGTIHTLLQSMGGGLAVIEDAQELQWLRDNMVASQGDDFSDYFMLDLKYDHDQKCFVWHDGTALGEFMDPDGLLADAHKTSDLCMRNKEIEPSTHHSYPYLYEIPGEILPTEITFTKYEAVLDMETTYQIVPLNKPVQLPVDMFLYESSDEEVLTVDENGLVTPVSLGTADVTVYSKDRAVYNHISFEVKDYVALESIAFKNESKTVAVGDTVGNSCVLYPADTTRQNVTYASSDETVVMVDQGGNLTGIASGTATVTATCEGITAEMTVTVFKKATSLSMVQASALESLTDAEEGTEEGTEQTDKVIPLPEVTVSAGAETDLTWQSTDTEVAEITEEGILLKGIGSTSLIVTDRNSGLSAVQQLFVIQEQPAPVVKLVESNCYYYALTEDGKLYHWNESNNAPVQVMENVADFDAYSGTILALKESGSVVKRSVHGNDLGLYDGSVETDFFRDLSPVGITFYNNGGGTHFVWTETGEVYAWGDDNGTGKLGVGHTNAVYEPTMLNLDAKVVQVKTQYYTTMFLTDTGDLYVAGSYLNTYEPVRIAQNVTDLHWADNNNIFTFRVGGEWAYAYSTDGKISYQTGYGVSDFDSVILDGNNYGMGIRDNQLSYRVHDEVTGIYSWIPVSGSYPDITAYLSAQGAYWFATNDGLLYGFGDNDNNQLGGAVIGDTDTPVVLPMGIVTGESITLTGTNLGQENVLTEDVLELSFNKSIINHGSVTVTVDGIHTAATVSHQHNKLTISKAAGFEVGKQYMVKIAASGFTGAADSALAETVEVSFTYAPDGIVVEGDQVIVPAVHKSQTDSSIVRYWTAKSLYEKIMLLQDEQQINSYFYGNVVLNHISTDFDVSHWLRPLAYSYNNGGLEIALGGNYWGTTNETAIGLQMIDYTDFINYGRFMYEPYLTQAPEDTFPFVTSVTVLDKNGEVVDTAGMEEITVRITFNRDMDTSIPLSVHFGSDYPYADYVVSDGDYVDARTWEGKYFISTVIGNGYQYFTIGNGRSATEDLELMTDRMRFLMHVDTTAAQALIMQGNATETGIQLSWTQDDFDTLMGYNVYRSTSEDGYYQRINATVIPADTMEFFDDTAEPGVLYYYNFTVVQTDLSESAPSGKIIIRAMDTMAPDIYHTPVYSAYAGESLVVSATVTDNLSISYASVFYRIKGQTGWTEARMNNLNSKYSAVIPANQVTTDGIEYYIEAFDGISYTYKGSAKKPYTVRVSASLDANSVGDVNGDGKISVLDALILLQGINDLYNLTQDEFTRADLDGNGVLEAKEALRILQYVNGSVGSLVV